MVHKYIKEKYIYIQHLYFVWHNYSTYQINKNIQRKNNVTNHDEVI